MWQQTEPIERSEKGLRDATRGIPTGGNLAPPTIARQLPLTSAPSPCLTSLVVSPCGVRVGFWISHYIVVSSPDGGVGGRWSANLRTLRTWRARAEPGVTPL